MIIAELRKLSKELQKALDRKPHKPRLQPLPPELAALYCTVCEDLMSSTGCPKHPEQKPLL